MGTTAPSAPAIPLLARALAYEGSLRARTEGITWAIWGFVLALVMLMYSSMGDVGDAAPWWSFGLWVPWVLAGSLLTWALWRTAALSVPQKEPAPVGIWVTLAWMAAIVAGLSVFSLAPRLPNPENSALVAIGIAWLIGGATNLFRATSLGRRVVILIGLLLCASGLAFSFALPSPGWSAPDADLVRFGQSVLRAGVTAGVPLAAGLWQALRG